MLNIQYAILNPSNNWFEPSRRYPNQTSSKNSKTCLPYEILDFNYNYVSEVKGKYKKNSESSI